MAATDYVGTSFTDVLSALDELRGRVLVMKREIKNRRSFDYVDSTQNGHLIPLAATLLKTSPDVLALSVLSTSPTDGATGVAVDAALTVTFDDVVAEATITAASVKLVAAGGGAADVATSNVSLSVGNTVATLLMASALTANTVYKFRVTTAATDLAGNALASTFTSANGFTTAP